MICTSARVAIEVLAGDEHHVAGAGEVRAGAVRIRVAPGAVGAALTRSDSLARLVGDVEEVVETFARDPLPRRDQYDQVEGHRRP